MRPAAPLKTDGSSQSIPIPNGLALLLSSSVQRYPSPMMVTRGAGGETAPPWVIERKVRAARAKIDGLPEEFSFHDLRHASARTTLDTYGHLWPDADESTHSTIGAVIAERMDSSKATADQMRTDTPS
jgi:integrase